MENTNRFATIFQRLKAYVLDCAILFAALILWQLALLFVNPLMKMMQSGQQPTNWQFQLWVFSTVTIPFLIYFAWTQSSAKKATLGMRYFRLEVNDLEGKRISLARALLRNIFLLVPFELNHTVMFHLMPRGEAPTFSAYAGITFVWIVIFVYLYFINFTARKQSIHDLISGTVVISKN